MKGWGRSWWYDVLQNAQNFCFVTIRIHLWGRWNVSCGIFFFRKIIFLSSEKYAFFFFIHFVSYFIANDWKCSHSSRYGTCFWIFEMFWYIIVHKLIPQMVFSWIQIQIFEFSSNTHVLDSLTTLKSLFWRRFTATILYGADSPKKRTSNQKKWS